MDYGGCCDTSYLMTVWFWLFYDGSTAWLMYINDIFDINLLLSTNPRCGGSVLARYLVDFALPQFSPLATMRYFFLRDGG